MNNSDFVHLHVHDEYSLLDGFGSPKTYCKTASEMGFKVLSITNHGNVDGAIQFQSECEKSGLESIIGCEMYIVPDLNIKQKEIRYHINLLVKNQTGYENLLKLITIGNLQGFYRKPRIDFKTLLKHKDGLIILTACYMTFLNCEQIVKSMNDKSIKSGIDYLRQFENVFLEVMPHDTKQQKEVNEKILKIEEFPLIATNDAHYPLQEHAKAQEVLLAIQRQAKWDDKDRWKFDIDDLYLKSADEMRKSFIRQKVLSREQIKKAMDNTLEVAELCSGFRIEKKPITLPNTIDGDSNRELRNLSLEGLNKKNLTSGEYKSRLRSELKVITDKGFSKYFLVVWDLLRHCNEVGMFPSPGRGSSGGSLVAYALNITQVDPIKHGLLFERFLAPERINYPDIDMDFQPEKREEVRRYLINKYGDNNVAGISTFLRLKSRAVIRDVARVFSVPYIEVDAFCKSIDSDLETSLSTNHGKRFEKEYPEIVRLSKQLENTIRGAGQHAGGIIVTENGELEKRASLVNRGGNIVANWAMEDCENQGLIKFDILGLEALTILDKTFKLIG